MQRKKILTQLIYIEWKNGEMEQEPTNCKLNILSSFKFTVD
jgi:hypothetical protein